MVTMVTKEMTVNRILHECPAARAILRRFHLETDWAGPEPLEQAAWYQGVHIEDIVEALDRIIAQGGER